VGAQCNGLIGGEDGMLGFVVDEYFSAHNSKPFPGRVDYTGRLLVKS